jgi:ABC-type molybdenum transport system ATPase subunit/photorepair protein PhrA
VLNLQDATVFKFGDADPSKALFRDLNWTIKEGEGWAVTGTQKKALIEVGLSSV